MGGVQYLTDDEGNKRAVVIDLEQCADIEDIMYVRAHDHEARHAWADIDGVNYAEAIASHS